MAVLTLIAMVIAPLTPWDDTVVAAVERCLRYQSSAIAERSPPSRTPPGLLDPAPMVRPLSGIDEGFIYEGSGAAEVCGVALYRPASPALTARLRALIGADTRWRPASPRYWQNDAPPGALSYWGDPRAAGLTGVMMVERPAGSAAPALEVQFHNILVR